METITRTNGDKMEPMGTEERKDLCRRMCEAVRDGDEALAWKLVREYAGLPPEEK